MDRARGAKTQLTFRALKSTFTAPLAVFILCIDAVIGGPRQPYAGRRTLLRHRHAVFDAQIAHRRNCVTADFAHGISIVVAGRMFAPSAELVSRYAETIVTETDPGIAPRRN